MYSRAGLSRTVALVVALSLTAVSTGAVARICAADTSSAIDLDRSNVARSAGFSAGLNVAMPLRFAASIIATQRSSASDRRTHAGAAARLIERIRKVE